MTSNVMFRWDAAPSMVDAATIVQRATGLTLERQQSSLYGGEHFRGRGPRWEVRVIKNFIEDDGAPFLRRQPVGTMLIELRQHAFANGKREQACPYAAAIADLVDVWMLG